MNSCEKFDSLIEEYLDGALSAEENEQFTEHISSCERCRKAVKMAENMHKALGSLEHSVEVPSDFLENIHKGIKKQSGHKSFITYTRRIGTLAACVVLAVIVAKGGMDSRLIKNAEELKNEETENAFTADVVKSQEQEEVFDGIDTTDATEDKDKSVKTENEDIQKKNNKTVQAEKKAAEPAKTKAKKSSSSEQAKAPQAEEKQTDFAKESIKIAGALENDVTGSEPILANEEAAEYTITEDTAALNIPMSAEVTAKDSTDEVVDGEDAPAAADFGEKAAEEIKATAMSGGGASARMAKAAVLLLAVEAEYIEQATSIANGYKAPQNGIYTMNSDMVKELMKDLEEKGIECTISEAIKGGDISFTIIGK